MENIIDSPFLELISDENIKKLKIDNDLIDEFKSVIKKIDKFFKENNLMDVRDWRSFFHKYLLTDSDEQVSICFNEYDNNSWGGCYYKKEKKISVRDKTVNSLCHEFIHFMVMHDSNSLNRKISDCRFINEGMTEFLTGCILTGTINGRCNSSSYIYEYLMAEFYCTMTKRNNPILHFLKDEYAFDDNVYGPASLECVAAWFDKNESYENLLQIQRSIISSVYDSFKLNSFNDFVEIVSAINKRVKRDDQYIDGIFEKIVDKYLDTLNIEGNLHEVIRKQLLDFCKISYKFSLYGDKAVSEYKIDDIFIAFDSDGNHYDQFPFSGEKYRGGILTDSDNIVITHRDKKYKIDRKKMEFRRWNNIYYDYYNKLKSYLDVTDNYSSENSSPITR